MDNCNPLSISLVRGGTSANDILSNMKENELFHNVLTANIIKTNFVKVITTKCNLKGKDILFNIDNKILPKEDVLILLEQKQYKQLKLYLINCFMVLYYTSDLDLSDDQINVIKNSICSIVDKLH